MTAGVRFRHASDTAWRRVDDQAAIISMDANRIRMLNPVGTFLWERCDGATLDELALSLSERYGLDRDTATRDAAAFLDDLKRRGMIHEEPLA
jgi:hypothetical protein